MLSIVSGNVTCFKALHLLNVSSGSAVILGNFTLSNAVQPLNIPFANVVILSGKITFFRFGQ